MMAESGLKMLNMPEMPPMMSSRPATAEKSAEGAAWSWRPLAKLCAARKKNHGEIERRNGGVN